MAISNPILGNNTIIDLKLGNKEVKKIYFGSFLIYNCTSKSPASATQIDFFYDSDKVAIDKVAGESYNIYIDNTYIETVE